jgi:chromosome segregation ATPase
MNTIDCLNERIAELQGQKKEIQELSDKRLEEIARLLTKLRSAQTACAELRAALVYLSEQHRDLVRKALDFGKAMTRGDEP